jgi:carotenoid 1,2-hydratase
MTAITPSDRAGIPAFDRPLADNGYAWWYIDAISEDGRYGLTLIAFIGSVFSPYYFFARGKGPTNPVAHCAINVALYGPGGRWCMTERGDRETQRTADDFQVGPSGLRWCGDALEITLDEWTAPLPRRIRGKVRVRPKVGNGEAIDLDADGRHQWTPVWPEARVDVELDHPGVRWSGTGYLDHNTGREPLESCFDSWSWLRAETRRGPVVLYDTLLCNRERRSLALHFDRDGTRHLLPSPDPVALPRSRWRLDRPARSEDGQARIEAVWEDTPFYTRSLVRARLLDEPITAVHESLSLRRFSNYWVQQMLPFRMPRRTRG